MIPSHLSSNCDADHCTACAAPVKQAADSGRWFITIGHAGFNLPANNGRGYATREAAVRAHARCKAAR
jgi:hypothetical protein